MSSKKQTTSSAANAFSIRQLVAAYNAYYRFGKYGHDDAKGRRAKKVKSTYPKLSFRAYSEEKGEDKAKNELRESRKFVINLKDFEAVSDFKKAYESGKANKVNVEPKQMNEDEYLNYIIDNHVYDIHLRSCLGIASHGFALYPRTHKAKGTATDEDEQIPAANIYYDYLIPQLGFAKRKAIEVKDYIDTLKEYFKSDALKIKAYNKIFPHPVRNANKDASGINYIFLQRLVPDHMSVISDVIDGKDDLDIIKSVAANLIKGKAELRKYQAQVILYVINGLPKVQRERRGVSIEEEDKQWASKLSPTPPSYKALEAISKLYRDLSSIKTFTAIIRSSMEAADEQGKDIHSCLAEYESICDELAKFNNRNATVSSTFKDFAQYIFDACCIIKRSFDIKDPLKLITASIKTKYEFKITKTMREKFNNLIKAEDDADDKNVVARKEQTLNEIANEFEQNINSISVVKGYDFLDTSFDVYSNVGKYCGVKLPKNYRVSMGIAIVKWINEHIDLFVAENKKREVLIIDIKE